LKPLEVTIVREVEAAAAVCIWNFCDYEHPPYVHQGYPEAFIMHEQDGVAVSLTTASVPIFRFLKSAALQVSIRKDEKTFVLYSSYFGAPSITTYIFDEPRKDFTVCTMIYRFYLTGWRRLLAPALRFLLPIWNRQIWEEDLPLKLRRQKVMRMGFKDFKGLPDKIEDRHYDGPIDDSLPIVRLKGSPVDKHDFKHAGD